MPEQQNREALQSYIRAVERHDLDGMEGVLDPDYVKDFPQSGERIRGRQNWRAIVENYPGPPNITDHSYVLSGDLGVLKMTFEYDGKRMYACEIVEFEDGKIKRATGYYGDPFEAPGWREQWVERM